MTHLTGPGQFSKFLTPGLRDEWIFEGEKGETIIAHVATRDFDSILGLALKGDKEDKELFPEVDDPGSDSRFSFRLPEKGQYKILVHAFKYKGGGNYELNVRRFLAKPLEVGKPAVGTFDRCGQGLSLLPRREGPDPYDRSEGDRAGRMEDAGLQRPRDGRLGRRREGRGKRRELPGGFRTPGHAL